MVASQQEIASSMFSNFVFVANFANLVTWLSPFNCNAGHDLQVGRVHGERGGMVFCFQSVWVLKLTPQITPLFVFTNAREKLSSSRSSTKWLLFRLGRSALSFFLSFASLPGVAQHNPVDSLAMCHGQSPRVAHQRVPLRSGHGGGTKEHLSGGTNPRNHFLLTCRPAAAEEQTWFQRGRAK